jgi:peptide/nickel transport system substrate-binding protein
MGHEHHVSLSQIDQRVLNRRQFLTIAGVAAGLTASVLLAACGGDDDDPTATMPASEPTSTAGLEAGVTVTAAVDEPTATMALDATATEAMDDPTATEPTEEPTPVSTEMTEPTEIYGFPIEPAQHEGGTIVWGVPWLHAGLLIRGIFPTQVFEAPIELHPETLEPMPLLATGWESSDDGTVWTFAIREGVTFHDGEVMDAEDVAFQVNLRAAAGWAGPPFDTVTTATPDSYTLVLEFEDIANDVAAGLEYYGVHAAHLLADQFDLADPELDLAAIEGHPANTGSDVSMVVGTGPFQFTEVVSGELERVARYDNYWRGAPHLDEIVYRQVASIDLYPAQINSGDIDLAGLGMYSVVDASQVDQFDSSVAQVLEYPGTAISMLMWNRDQQVLEDPRVRQALLFAIDRGLLVESVLFGYGEVPLTLSTLTTMFDPDGITNRYTYDPERAAQLFDEAGWLIGEDGVRQREAVQLAFKIVFEASDTVHEAVATILQEYWREIGVAAEIEAVETSILWPGVIEGSLEWDATFWVTPSISMDQRGYYGCPNGEPGIFGYCNDEAEALMNAVASELDAETRYQLNTQLLNLFMDDLPGIPVFIRNGLTAVSNRIHNVYPYGVENYGWNAWTWWVDA